MIQLWFDLVCPFAWLAARQLPAVAARAGVPLVWRPMLLGGVLRALGVADPNDVMPPAKVAVIRRDARRQAELQGLQIRFPEGHPRRTVDAMRLLTASPPAVVPKLAEALWHAYWVAGDDIADRAVLARLGARFGVALAAVDDPSVKAALRASTDAAVRAGVFGAPGIEVAGRVHWGADRLWLVERALGLAPSVDPLGGAVPAVKTGRTLHIWHDFSSPFSYLAATGIEALAARFGATVTWRPVLLGALFREIGTVDVPLHTYSAARQGWTLRDLDDYAAERGVPFRFPTRFPIRSVLPLRVALLEPRATLPIYRAAWAEDRDIASPELLAAILEEAGLSGAVVGRAAEAKAELVANTAEASTLGVIGVPSFEVGGTWVWGQDRFDHLARVLAGWQPEADR